MTALAHPLTRLLLPGLVLLALAAGLGTLITLSGPAPLPLDTWWNGLLLAWRVAAVEAFALTMGVIGGVWVSIVVGVLATVGMLLLRRPRGALFVVVVQVVSLVIVQVLKHLFGRARPEEIIVVSDYGSFPSGHTANAATVAAIAVVLFPRLWVVIAGAVWVVLMAFSRTYLHAHWVSDTLGGALAGAGAVLVTAAVLAPLLQRDPQPARPA